MTPAQRFDDLTAEDQWARDDIREARRVAYVVASDVVQMTHRQIGTAMQRDQKAIHHGIGKARRDMKGNALLRKVVADVSARVRGAVQDFRLFGAEVAE